VCIGARTARHGRQKAWQWQAKVGKASKMACRQACIAKGRREGSTRGRHGTGFVKHAARVSSASAVTSCGYAQATEMQPCQHASAKMREASGTGHITTPEWRELGVAGVVQLHAAYSAVLLQHMRSVGVGGYAQARNTHVPLFI